MATSVEAPETIIRDVAKGLGLDPGETAFDSDIQVYCNMAALDLEQVGVIKSPIIMTTTLWIELGYEGINPKEELISYFVLVTKLHFDPPQPSMVQTFKETIFNNLERLRNAQRSRELKEVKK